MSISTGRPTAPLGGEIAFITGPERPERRKAKFGHTGDEVLMLGLRRSLAGALRVLADVLFRDLQEMRERPLRHLNRCDLDVALAANAGYLDSLGFILQAVEVQKVARFAADFDGNGCRFVV